MSKIFFDHLINFDKLESEINSLASSPEEKEELWVLVDEMVHHRIIKLILDRLAPEHHTNFLDKFHQQPHDESLILFLKEKIQAGIEQAIKDEATALMEEILHDVQEAYKGEY